MRIHHGSIRLPREDRSADKVLEPVPGLTRHYRSLKPLQE